MQIENIPVSALIPYARNPRKNDDAVDAVAASIKEFGFNVPLVIDAENTIVCGHTRLKAAQKLGIESLPCIRKTELTEQQLKAYRILDNKIAEKAEWDTELLALELDEIDLDLESFDVDFATTDNLENETEIKDVDLKSVFEIVIECSDESEQESFYKKLKKEGYQCRVLTL